MLTFEINLTQFQPWCGPIYTPKQEMQSLDGGDGKGLRKEEDS